MNRLKQTCGTCGGFGKYTWFEVVSENTCERREGVCSQCEGRGYTEYAVFSIEEAEAILKHCGLSVGVE